jgi:S-DNA-T family DNA segregation ATPase FtsK/SpoIIIE
MSQFNERLIQKQLERQSSDIESALRFHKVQARVTGGEVSPRWTSFDLQLPLGQRVNRVMNLSDELALALQVSDVRIRRRGGRLQIQVPREAGRRVNLPDLLAAHADDDFPPITAVLGVAESGRPLLLRMPSPDVAHVMIAGTTGSGKTALLRTIALSLAWRNPQRRLQLVPIDPKGRGLAPLASLPHSLSDLIVDYNDAVDWLGYLVDLMEERDREGSAEPTIVVVLDELAELLQQGGQVMKDLLVRLAQRGREAGIHLVCGTQKPSAGAVGSLLKANFPVRLVGRVVSADEARVAAGIGGTGAERLSSAGDFVAVAGGQVTRFQAAYLSEQEIHAMIETIWDRVSV